jgi:hypothetical protein
MYSTTPYPCDIKFNSIDKKEPRSLDTDLQARFKYIVEVPRKHGMGPPDIDLSTQMRWPVSPVLQSTATQAPLRDRPGVTFIQPFSRACEEPQNIAVIGTQQILQPTYANMTLFVTQHDAEMFRKLNN